MELFSLASPVDWQLLENKVGLVNPGDFEFLSFFFFSSSTFLSMLWNITEELLYGKYWIAIPRRMGRKEKELERNTLEMMPC